MSKNKKLDVKFNLKQFDIDMKERDSVYHIDIRDRITNVIYRREAKPEELYQVIRDTFERIQKYRIWWKEVSIMYGEEVYI